MVAKGADPRTHGAVLWSEGGAMCTCRLRPAAYNCIPALKTAEDSLCAAPHTNCARTNTIAWNKHFETYISVS